MQVPKVPVNKEGMETTEHGSAAFPLAAYHSVMSKNVLGHIPWHWHKEIQLCRVTAGEIRFFVNEKEYLLQKGEGIFINSGYLHMARPEKDPDSAYICLDADPRLLASFSGSIFEEKYVIPFLRDPAMADRRLSPLIPGEKEILEYISRIYILCEEPEFGDEFRITALLGEVWRLLLTCRSEESALSPRGMQENDAVQRILTFMEDRYDRRITLSDIATAASYSAGECCRIFKKVTGETIFAYLRTYRLAKGMELLKNTDLSVSQIAYDIGFCSASYFTETFKAQLGVTPLQYRKETKDTAGK
ncbi:MAG: helix-turn-helix domain-containing protein [Clostridia bacterium]